VIELSLKLLSPEEAEKLIAKYMEKSVSYSFGKLQEGSIVFVLKDEKAIIVNPDGSVTWQLTEITIGLHSFLELTTGEQNKRTVYIPLCLVNPEIRQRLSFLLSTTIDPSDGRLNSKPAHFYIANPKGKGFKVQVRLAGLALNYIMIKLFPPDFPLKFKSKHCPLCKQISPEPA